ncbi:MAG: aldo/keto reductase [Proteobacteria bacterium]|nr:aldo/keto reductase [Pseudomonadota bacterium]
MNENDNKENGAQDVSRRDFLKKLGVGSVATTAAISASIAGVASMSGCRSDKEAVPHSTKFCDVPAGQMSYRTQPRTGDRVSLLGYGCMRWPQHKNADGEDVIHQEAVNEMVDYAIAHGVNFFDVAPPYIRGLAEPATGIALERHPRDKFFVATKLSTHRGDPSVRTFEGSKAIYEKSFENLRVDYIDYYFLHCVGIGGMEALKARFYDNGILDFLVKEREAGKIRHLGWSFHGDIEAFDFLLAQQEVPWDFVMIQMNYIDWQNASGWNTNAEYLMGELEKRKIPVIIMEPLLGGRLARLNSKALNVLKSVNPEASAASWALRYAGTPESVLTVLSGMTYIEHLKENICTFSPLVPLTPKEYAALDEVTKIMISSDYVQCTECEYCMPCPYGVDIPGVFSHYNKMVSTGYRLKSSNDENYKKIRKAFLVSYDRSIPRIRQADKCIDCGICVKSCPQGIKIPDEMRRIDLYAEQLKQRMDF